MTYSELVARIKESFPVEDFQICPTHTRKGGARFEGIRIEVWIWARYKTLRVEAPTFDAVWAMIEAEIAPVSTLRLVEFDLGRTA